MADAKANASAVRRIQRDLRQWEKDKEELGLPVLIRQLEPRNWLARLAITMVPKVSTDYTDSCSRVACRWRCTQGTWDNNIVSRKRGGIVATVSDPH